ncbi:hypothetical protein AB0H36_37725 [Kribbella sp. NPDC050820]|uniref:hypothetical protein n=1 Tax=Kribbella sp. NPDC050820 TaxID=3155408 RepID=UPI0033C88C4D
MPDATPLFPDLSVAENIAMGRQPLGRFKTIDRAAMVHQAAQLFTRLGVSIDPNPAGPRPVDRPADRVHRGHHRPVQLLRTAL